MPDQKREPYLSIVAASRNDNHGGDMLKRMRVFVAGLIHQCNAYKLPCELIMVEWNPIESQQLLNEILPAPAKDDYLTIRYIQVPPAIHETLAFSKQIPLFQMIAKNVGIRRATANFVLCTNIDILFSDALFKNLAKRNLQQNCFYRANRCDVPGTLDENWPIKQQLEFCRNNIVKRLGKNPLYANFKSTSGFLFKHKLFKPALMLLAKIKAGYATSVKDRFDTLDLDACGDFTLMDKKSWIDIQGYPELEIYSIHIDSMGVIAAAALNKQQVIFKDNECCYHMEHAGGWEFKTPIDKIHFYTKKPMLDWWSVREAGLYLMEKKTTYNLNENNWGFSDTVLQEIVLP